MQAFFLEEPLYLVPTVVFLQLILVSHWLRNRTPTSGRLALGAFFVFLGLVVLQVVVKTDRERIEAVLRDLARIVERADATAFAAHLSDDLSLARRSGETWDRDHLVQRFARTLQVYRVEDSRYHRMKIETHGDRATVQLGANCRIIAPTERYPSLLSRWDLEFVKRGGAWKLSRVTRATVEPVGLDLLNEML